MYKVIIADDEESIRNRIISMTEKLSDIFTVVGVYENGFDALENGVPLEPDIIITDIRMPYISGIELIKQAKLELPLVQSVIVSGYDSFDYAKEAIKLGVCGYLTKPVIFAEFKDTMMKVKESLDEQLNVDKNIKHLEEQAQYSLRLVQSEDLSRLMTMKTIPENLKEKLEEDKINLNAKYQCIVVFDADDEELQYEEEDILQYFLERYVESEFSQYPIHYMFYSDNTHMILLGSDEKIKITELVSTLHEIILMMKKVNKISISAGVSDVMSENINYRKMNRHARRSLEYRTVMGKNVVLCFDDLERNDTHSSKIGKIDDNEYKQLSYLISYGRKDDVYEKISALLDTICTPNYKDSYFFVLGNILDSILKSCMDLSKLSTNFETQAEITRQIFSIKNKENLYTYFLKVIDEVFEINNYQRMSGLEVSYDRIVHYIEMHYSDSSLSIEDVANELSYSISYVSAILKKNGTTFTKLTTECRMNKALVLLADVNNRIITIAKEVGYTDPYYFSHCFKKFSGMSPDDYRKNKVA